MNDDDKKVPSGNFRPSKPKHATECETWHAVNDALLAYSQNPSLATAHDVEDAAQALRRSEARFASVEIEKEIISRKALS